MSAGPGPATATRFSVAIDQNPYLAGGAGRVDAVVSVTSSDAGSSPVAAEALEMIILDCSSSMEGEKIRQAREATVAAIAELRDGVSFVVIEGRRVARQVYPEPGTTATADARSRDGAAAAVGRLEADGGTGIGTWLTLARQVAERHPDAIRHAILLTDGRNGERPDVLAAKLASCVGAFTCDCRGVGTGWRVDELRKISSALLGTVDIVADAADLAADFRAMVSASMGKAVAGVRLRLWSPKAAKVCWVRQVAPTVEDLTERRADAGTQRGDYPLGSWGAETRSYHVCIEVPPQAIGAEMLAARVSVVRGSSDDVLAQGLVTATWTDELAMSARISREVAHFTGQAELAEMIQEGLAARRIGDDRAATARLGRAVALASESANDGTARLLRRVVEVIDAPSGTVRLREQVDQADEMALDTRSTRTVRIRSDQL